MIDIDVVLFNLVGGSDDDAVVDYYDSLGELTEKLYREIIKKEILPGYKKLRIRKQLLKVLEDALNCPDYDFERLFYSNLPPFDLTVDARQFFVWIYEELSNYQNYLDNNAIVIDNPALD